MLVERLTRGEFVPCSIEPAPRTFACGFIPTQDPAIRPVRVASLHLQSEGDERGGVAATGRPGFDPIRPTNPLHVGGRLRRRKGGSMTVIVIAIGILSLTLRTCCEGGLDVHLAIGSGAATAGPAAVMARIRGTEGA